MNRILRKRELSLYVGILMATAVFGFGIVGSSTTSAAQATKTLTPMPNGGNWQFTFICREDDISKVYVMDEIDSSTSRKLIQLQGEIQFLRWSFDRSQGIFSLSKDHTIGFYVVNADGSNAHLLFDDLPGVVDSSEGWAWSPDGRQIAFEAYQSMNNIDIYVINVDGSNRRRLTDTPAAEDGVTWSPDGRQIAFNRYSDTDDGNEIYVMNEDGTNIRQLTQNPMNAHLPKWSPDGTQIVFVSDHEEGYDEIYLMDANGGHVRRLTNITANTWNPTWSPEGTRIAFDAQAYPVGQIYVINRDGSNLRNLTNDSTWNTHPQWSPDGAQIAFYSDRERHTGTYIADTDGNNIRWLGKLC